MSHSTRAATSDWQGPAIAVSGLTKKFGSFAAVDDLSFEVAPGRITGFLGPNGAGKTTTLRMLLGLVRPTAGTASINGRPYHDLPDPARMVGAALEATDFHPGRSGRDHLRVVAVAAGISDSRVDELLELTGIPAFAHKRAGEYSMGMRQRLSLAAALLGDPEVLILDEPANGLDPDGIRWLRNFLRHLASERGKTILISSHLLQEVEQTVDEVVIIGNGRLLRQGTVADLRGDRSVLVRTSDPTALSTVLREAGLQLTPEEPKGEGGLVVTGSDLRRIGDLAYGAGLPVWELTERVSDLEELFFSLTEGTNRNLGGRAGPPASEEGGA